jgi:hypothetical protein
MTASDATPHEAKKQRVEAQEPDEKKEPAAVEATST